MEYNLNGVANNHSFASYPIQLFPPRCSGFRGSPSVVCFWMEGVPWLEQPVSSPVSCPDIGEAPGGMEWNGVIPSLPLPGGRGTDRNLDGCLGGD